MTSGKRGVSAARGFTLIELVVVMAIVGLLLALAAPRYIGSIDRGKANVQRQNMAVLREAIDKFHGDLGRYPETLDELVDKRYLRAVPVDPVSERTDWRLLPPPGEASGVYDVALPEGSAEAEGS
jgi:general secretion pathway protein G